TDTVALAAPRTAFRELRGGNADFSFKLAAAPKNPIEVDVLDSKGALVAKLPPVTGHSGLNRITWDMRYPGPRRVALRTTPPENPHIWEEPRFQGQDTRPITHWGIAQAETGPFARPGDYTVKMTVDGQTLSKPLHIALPPNAHGSEADI